MSHKFLFNASFHLFLEAIDRDFMNEQKKAGCGCGGRLHQADYPRSPLGLPALLRTYYEQRFSLCCADCRKRITPKTVRFFGRCWFPAPILLLISVLSLGINERRIRQVKIHLGIIVSETTWRRWRRWWREHFIATQFWQQFKGLLRADCLQGIFPRNLLISFSGYLKEKIILLLQFLSPITAGFLRAV